MDIASVNFKEIGSNITDLSINNDLSSYLELIKNSSFNTKEMITENSDEFISSSAVFLNEIDTIAQSLKINNKSKDFAKLEVLDPFIYLTEDGFSSPVGIFNPLTRIAELTEDLSDKTLIITIGNILFDGNNHTINNRTFFLGAVFINEGLNNILIENINIINANFGITVKEKTLDITIKCCNISITNSGILAKFTRNLQVYNNQIISNNFGILYLESCSYSCITNNDFVNNNKAIYLAKENSFNTISNNSITNKVFFSNEVGICLGTYNSYNLINHNTVVFSDRTFRFKDSSITVISNAILFNTGTNNINAIRDNTFEYKNNSFTVIADTIDIKGSIKIRETNLFTVSNVSNEISKNNLKVANNNIFSPILFLTENHSCVIKHNLLSYPMSTGIVLGYINTLNIIEGNTTNISIPSDSFNYVFNNIVKC